MPALALSVVDALTALGLAAAGFVVVVVVCAVVLAALHVVLPSTDTGAAELDRLRGGEEGEGGEAREESGLDTGGNT